MPSTLEIRSGTNKIQSRFLGQGDVLESETSEQVSQAFLADLCRRIADAFNAGNWDGLLGWGNGLGRLLIQWHTNLGTQSQIDPVLTLRLTEDLVGLPWEVISI